MVRPESAFVGIVWILAISACDDPSGGGSADTSGADVSPADTSGGDSGVPDTSAPDTTPGETAGPDTGNPSVCGFSPCGGAGIVGTWSLQSICVSEAFADNPFTQFDNCEDSTFVASPTASGQFVFGADATFTYSLDLGGDVQLGLDADCMAGLAGVTCDTLAAQFAGEGATLTCSASGGGCNCSGTIAGQVTQGSGTYRVEGSTLTLDETDDPTSATLCIQGNTMKVQRFDEGDEGPVESVLTLTR